MNRKFDALKQTLTGIVLGKPDTPGAHAMPPPPQSGALSSLVGVPVPKGRTTLNVSRIGGTLRPAETQPPAQPLPAPAAPVSPVVITAEPPVIDTAAEPSPIDQLIAEMIPEADDFTVDFEQITAQAAQAKQEPEPEMIPGEIDQPPPPVISEEIAAMRVKVTTPIKPPKKAPELDDKVLMNLRVPLYLKNAFYKKCHDRGVTPSITLRNLLKEFCGLCLILMLLLLPSPAVAQAKGDTYTTAQILTYLQRKAFGAMDKVPNVRGTIGARHALWQTGAPDPVDDFTYTDYSNTRLEAKIEVPIFDLSYLRNKDKEKIEHRAFVMKSLSQILAAQRAVKVLETTLSTTRQRRDYVSEQIKLRLANRSDLFVIEDRILQLQAQLYEAESTLEQRIIDLAVLAENDWLEAYAMIIKWDGVLFDKIDKGGRRK